MVTLRLRVSAIVVVIKLERASSWSCAGPDLGGGAGLPPTGGLPPNPSIFQVHVC